MKICEHSGVEVDMTIQKPTKPMNKRIRLFLHSNKDSNADLAQRLGLDLNSDAGRMFLYLGYEVELIFDVDLKTGEGKLVAADGKFLGDERITPGEIDE